MVPEIGCRRDKALNLGQLSYVCGHVASSKLERKPPSSSERGRVGVLDIQQAPFGVNVGEPGRQNNGGDKSKWEGFLKAT